MNPVLLFGGRYECPGFDSVDNNELTDMLNEAREDLEKAASEERDSIWHRESWAIFCALRAEVEARGYMSGLEH